jgi:hypothetical protein
MNFWLEMPAGMRFRPDERLPKVREVNGRIAWSQNEAAYS